MATIFLAQINCYDPSTGGTSTIKFATGSGFFSGSDVYPPRLQSPGSISFSINTSEGGKRTLSFGELSLHDPDGVLSATLSGYFFDGRDVTVLTIDPAIGWGSSAIVYRAIIETAAFTLDSIRFRLRDRAAELDVPFSTLKYAGTNSAGAGVEGAEDLKDRYKPRIFGRVAHMEAVCVNTAKLEYQVNSVASLGNTASIAEIINVFDAGAYLVPQFDSSTKQPQTYSGSTAANQITAMEAAAPASNDYLIANKAGLFRLARKPFGTVTACVTSSWDINAISAAGIIQSLLTEKGYSVGDQTRRWKAADMDAMNALNAAPLGLIVQDGETTASLLGRICQSIGAWWGFSRDNYFRTAIFEAPETISLPIYSAEMATNGGFSGSLTGWTAIWTATGNSADYAGIAIADVWTNQVGAADCCTTTRTEYDSVPYSTRLQQAQTLTSGIPYSVTFTILVGGNYDPSPQGSIQPRFTGGSTVSGTVRSALGTYTETMYAASGNTTFEFITGGAGFNGAIDNVSLKAITFSMIDQILNGTFSGSLSNWTAIWTDTGNSSNYMGLAITDVWTNQTGTADCCTLTRGDGDDVFYSTTLYQAQNLVPGLAYELTYTLVEGGYYYPSPSGSITPKFAGGSTVSGTTRTTLGTFTDTLTAVAGNNVLQFVTGASGFNGAIDNVKLVPANVPLLTLDDSNIIEIERQADDWKPLYSATVECDINYSQAKKEQTAGIVTDDRLGWLSRESRNQGYADSAVQTVRPLAINQDYPSLMNGLSSALAEAKRRKGLYSVRRDNLTVQLNGALQVMTLDCGVLVKVQTARLGYAAGRMFVITGVSANFDADTIELNLWG